MKLFNIDVKLAGTVYVKAVDKTEAKRKAEQFMSDGFEFSGPGISEDMLDNPNLPVCSLSPSFTGHGI